MLTAAIDGGDERRSDDNPQWTNECAPNSANLWGCSGMKTRSASRSLYCSDKYPAESSLDKSIKPR
eukprot:scaffold241088_cov53-Attheya_sp.AAC.2